MRPLPIVLAALLAPSLAGCPPDGHRSRRALDDSLAVVQSAVASTTTSVVTAQAAAARAAELARVRLLAVAADPEASRVLGRAAWSGVKGDHVRAALLLVSLLPVEDPETGRVVRYGWLAERRVERMPAGDAYDPEAVAFLLMLDPAFFRGQRVLRTGPGAWATPEEAAADYTAALAGSPGAYEAALRALLGGDGPACLAALEPVLAGLQERNGRYLDAPGRALLEAARERLRAGDWRGFEEAYTRFADAVLAQANAGR